MAECFICGDFVGEKNGDGGLKGFTIGGRDICLSCLGELKYRLEQVTPKQPTERTYQYLAESDDEDVSESSSSGRETAEESDPFSAKP